MRPIHLAATVLVLVGATIRGVAAPDVGRIEPKIDIREQGFMPSTLEISIGERVMWANMTKVPQRVVAATTVLVKGPDGRDVERPAFDSGEIPADRYFEWTFNDPGFFEFYNPADPTLRGSVTVTDPD